jgi:hypothetical protein
VNLRTDAVRSAACGLRRGARPGRSALVAQGKTGQELNTRVGVDQDLLRGESAGAAARAELASFTQALDLRPAIPAAEKQAG